MKLQFETRCGPYKIQNSSYFKYVALLVIYGTYQYGTRAIVLAYALLPYTDSVINHIINVKFPYINKYLKVIDIAIFRDKLFVSLLNTESLIMCYKYNNRIL